MRVRPQVCPGTGSLCTTHVNRCTCAWVSATRDIIVDEHVIARPLVGGAGRPFNSNKVLVVSNPATTNKNNSNNGGRGTVVSTIIYFRTLFFFFFCVLFCFVFLPAVQLLSLLLYKTIAPRRGSAPIATTSQRHTRTGTSLKRSLFVAVLVCSFSVKLCTRLKSYTQ